MYIYVGNLSRAVTEDDLKREFVTFGSVISVTFMNDHGIGSGQGKVCGYVEMLSVNEGDLAIEKLQGISIKGCKLEIIKALPITRDLKGDINGYERASKVSRKVYRRHAT